MAAAQYRAIQVVNVEESIYGLLGHERASFTASFEVSFLRKVLHSRVPIGALYVLRQKPPF